MLVEVNGSLNAAIKVLKGKIAKDGLMAEVRRREAYQSPSERRREKDATAKRRKLKHSRLKVWKATEKKKRGH